MDNELKEIVYSEDEIKDIVKRLGDEITKDYKDKNLLVICILKGSVVFMTDLIREINLPVKIDFMAVSSYGNDVKSSGEVRIIKDLDMPLEDYDVLIVEDILDSGITLNYITKLLSHRNPKSIEICTLLDKSICRKADVFAKYIGSQVGDKFIVGYGLDYAEYYRNLPYIAVLDSTVYNK